jgi:hypothetical protein
VSEGDGVELKAGDKVLLNGEPMVVLPPEKPTVLVIGDEGTRTLLARELPRLEEKLGRKIIIIGKESDTSVSALPPGAYDVVLGDGSEASTAILSHLKQVRRRPQREHLGADLLLLAAAAAGGSVGGPPLLRLFRKRQAKTPNPERMSAAEEKRSRKAAKRLGRKE